MSKEGWRVFVRRSVVPKVINNGPSRRVEGARGQSSVPTELLQIAQVKTPPEPLCHYYSCEYSYLRLLSPYGSFFAPSLLIERNCHIPLLCYPRVFLAFSS